MVLRFRSVANGEKSKENNTLCSNLDQNKMVLCAVKTTFLVSSHFSCPALPPLCGFSMAPACPLPVCFPGHIPGRKKEEEWDEMVCSSWVSPLKELSRKFHSTHISLARMMLHGDLYLQGILGNYIYIYTHTHIHTVDLQCCVSFWCTAKWFSYTYIYSFSYSSPLWFITRYWDSSLCYTIGPCCLSPLYMIVCICWSRTPNPSLPCCPSLLATTSLFSVCESVSLS